MKMHCSAECITSQTAVLWQLRNHLTIGPGPPLLPWNSLWLKWISQGQVVREQSALSQVVRELQVREQSALSQAVLELRESWAGPAVRPGQSLPSLCRSPSGVFKLLPNGARMGACRVVLIESIQFYEGHNRNSTQLLQFQKTCVPMCA